MSASKIVLEASVLRAWGEYTKAIRLIEQNIKKFDEAEIVPARLEAIYAALAAKKKDVAIKHAKALAKIEPEMPTVKKVLRMQ